MKKITLLTLFALTAVSLTACNTLKDNSDLIGSTVASSLSTDASGSTTGMDYAAFETMAEKIGTQKVLDYTKSTSLKSAFNILDTNKDGALSKSEVSGIEKKFTQPDAATVTSLINMM